jgi:hypothetical protein
MSVAPSSIVMLAPINATRGAPPTCVDAAASTDAALAPIAAPLLRCGALAVAICSSGFLLWAIDNNDGDRNPG